MRGTDQLDSQHLFPKLGESKTRGYRFKVRGRDTKGSRGANISSQRVVSVLNELSEVVVEAGTILSFEKHLDSYIGKMSLRSAAPSPG